jgi:hypothetical protein
MNFTDILENKYLHFLGINRIYVRSHQQALTMNMRIYILVYS